MRIATWNVNSLKARQEAVENWLKRAEPGRPAHAGDEADRRRRAGDGLRDGRLPAGPPRRGPLERGGDRGPRGRHDRGRRHELRRRAGPRFRPRRRRRRNASEDDFDPFDEARMVAATVDGMRFVSLYAPNGRVVGSPFYAGKLAWFERLARWVREDAGRGRRRSSSVATSTSPRPTRTSGMPPRSTAGRTSRSPSGPPSGRCWSPGSPTPTVRAMTSPAASRGGTTAPACSTRTSECASTTCWCRRRSPAASWMPRSTATPGRDRPCHRTTRRCSSTSTSRAARSTPTGTERSLASPPGPSRGAEASRTAATCLGLPRSCAGGPSPSASSGVRTRGIPRATRGSRPRRLDRAGRARLERTASGSELIRTRQ